MARKLTGRARTYAEAITQLSARKNIGGKIVRVDYAARYVALSVRLSNSLDVDNALKLSEPLALACGTPAVVVQRERGTVVYQFQLASGYWLTYTRQELTQHKNGVGLGFDGPRQVDFQFTQNAPHSGFFGTTGSGKSVAVASLLCGLFAQHEPDQLNAAIVDPDGDYHDDFRNVAHLNGLPIARSPQQTDHVLNFVHGELVRRRRSQIRDGPRFVCVVDEAEDVLEDPRRLGIAQRIAKDGRKFNMNLILASQKPTERTLPDLLPEVLNRWVGLVSDGRVSAYLTGHKGLNAHQLTGSGDFLHVVGGSTQERLLVAMPTRDDFDRLPRCELATPGDFNSNQDIVTNVEPPDTNGRSRSTGGPGRPSHELDASTLARYMLDEPTQADAKSLFDLGRPTHRRYKKFAQDLIQELRRLSNARTV